ncbi:MAG: hypothetical protein ACJ796_07740 [Gemmatimonadaceae bacterium]
MKSSARIESLAFQLQSGSADHVSDDRGSEAVHRLGDDRYPEHDERREVLVVRSPARRPRTVTI